MLEPVSNIRMAKHMELFSNLYFLKILLGSGFYVPRFIPWLVL